MSILGGKKSDSLVTESNNITNVFTKALTSYTAVNEKIDLEDARLAQVQVDLEKKIHEANLERNKIKSSKEANLKISNKIQEFFGDSLSA